MPAVTAVAEAKGDAVDGALIGELVVEFEGLTAHAHAFALGEKRVVVAHPFARLRHPHEANLVHSQYFLSIGVVEHHGDAALVGVETHELANQFTAAEKNNHHANTTPKDRHNTHRTQGRHR